MIRFYWQSWRKWVKSAETGNFHSNTYFLFTQLRLCFNILWFIDCSFVSKYCLASWKALCGRYTMCYRSGYTHLAVQTWFTAQLCSVSANSHHIVHDHMITNFYRFERLQSTVVRSADEHCWFITRDLQQMCLVALWLMCNLFTMVHFKSVPSFYQTIQSVYVELGDISVWLCAIDVFL